MKLKIIIYSGLVLLIAAIAFMVKDLYFDKSESDRNPYNYDLKKLREVNPELIGYKESQTIKSSVSEICAIAIDSEDKMYVAGKDSVEIFDATEKSIKQFRTDGQANCMAVNKQNNIFLGIDNHIDIYTFDGKKTDSWKIEGTKTILTSIAVSDSFVFVADAGNKLVYRFDTKGKLLGKIGVKNLAKGDSGFIIPSPFFDIAIGRDNELWIVNPGKHSLNAYSFDGHFISSWERSAMEVDGFCGCCNPSHIAMLSDGSFVTSEKSIERVKVHKQNGDFKCVVAPPTMFQEGTHGLDLAVDSKDRIFVLDPVKNLVHIFVEK